MTVIIAAKLNSTLFLAADSSFINGWTRIHTSTPKVFMRMFNGKPMLIGLSGEAIAQQILQFSQTFLPGENVTIPDYEWICTSFVPAMREALEKHKTVTVDNGKFKSPSETIICYDNEIYTIDGAGHVGIIKEPYTAIGCGSDFAVGYLDAIFRDAPIMPWDGTTHNPYAGMSGHLFDAIACACNHSAGCTMPVDILKLSNGSEEYVVSEANQVTSTTKIHGQYREIIRWIK